MIHADVVRRSAENLPEGSGVYRVIPNRLQDGLVVGQATLDRPDYPFTSVLST
jgi:hypothetical protein